MDAQQNGSISLEVLARRLEALERENAELRGKMAALEGSDDRRKEVEAKRGSKPSEGLEESRISRRRLLGKAGAAAAGLVVAGALTQRDIREAKAAAPETFTSNVAGTPGVTGTNTAGGIGVKAEGAVGVFGDNFGSGEGVRGVSSGGYGGLFSGGKAQLKLIPGGSSGRPGGGHSKGEIYMGSGGALFVCVQGGRPGKWRKVSTTAVP
jgi:hypothetical protein